MYSSGEDSGSVGDAEMLWLESLINDTDSCSSEEYVHEEITLPTVGRRRALSFPTTSLELAMAEVVEEYYNKCSDAANEGDWTHEADYNHGTTIFEEEEDQEDILQHFGSDFFDNTFECFSPLPLPPHICDRDWKPAARTSPPIAPVSTYTSFFVEHITLKEQKKLRQAGIETSVVVVSSAEFKLLEDTRLSRYRCQPSKLRSVRTLSSSGGSDTCEEPAGSGDGDTNEDTENSEIEELREKIHGKVLEH